MSRTEEILRATIDGDEYTKTPQSREEELLIELKQTIEAGGGGASVVPNPEGEATETLTKLGVNDTVYGIPSGGGGNNDFFVVESKWDIVRKVNVLQNGVTLGQLYDKYKEGKIVIIKMGGVLNNTDVQNALLFSTQELYDLGDYWLYFMSTIRPTTIHLETSQYRFTFFNIARNGNRDSTTFTAESKYLQIS